MGLWHRSRKRGTVEIDSFDMHILSSILAKPYIVKELVNLTHLAPKNLNIHVKKLVERGFIQVRRLPPPEHQYKEITITNKGKRLYELLS